MDEPDQEILRQLLKRVEMLDEDLSEKIDDLGDQVRSQNEGIMRILDRLGPADPPSWPE